MVNVIVTGAAGFIGYALCKFLTGKGQRVIAIDTGEPQNGFSPDIAFMQTDFRELDAEYILKKFGQIKFVYHLASAHLKINLDESDYLDINANSLPGFVFNLKKTGVEKLIHVSSVGIYGNQQTIPANEDSEKRPLSIYGESKLQGESKIRQACNENNMEFCIIRPAWVYGITCPRTQKLIRMLRKRRFFWIGKGQNLRHPVYIDDLLRALKLAAESPAANGQTLIIAGPDYITSAQLVKTICQANNLRNPAISVPLWLARPLANITEHLFRLISAEPPFSTRTLEFFTTNNAFDISKAKKIINFQPEFDFSAGMSKIIEIGKTQGA